jgi:C4-type Zn-finger protein
MTEYEAGFEIESKADAYAVEGVLTRLYDTIREETRTVREETTDSTEMLDQFATIHDVAQDPSPGRSTVIYEREDEPFEE